MSGDLGDPSAHNLHYVKRFRCSSAHSIAFPVSPSGLRRGLGLSCHYGVASLVALALSYRPTLSRGLRRGPTLVALAYACDRFPCPGFPETDSDPGDFRP